MLSNGGGKCEEVGEAWRIKYRLIEAKEAK